MIRLEEWLLTLAGGGASQIINTQTYKQLMLTSQGGAGLSVQLIISSTTFLVANNVAPNTLLVFSRSQSGLLTAPANGAACSILPLAGSLAVFASGTGNVQVFVSAIVDC